MAENGIITFLKRLTSPNAPSVGKVNLYAKDDDILYAQNSAGVESPLAMGGVWQNWTPSNVGDCSIPTIALARYVNIGKLVMFNLNAYDQTLTGSPGYIRLTLPIVAQSLMVSTTKLFCQVYPVNGSYQIVRSELAHVTPSNFLIMKDLVNAQWAGNEAGLYFFVNGFYEIA